MLLRLKFVRFGQSRSNLGIDWETLGRSDFFEQLLENKQVKKYPVMRGDYQYWDFI